MKKYLIILLFLISENYCYSQRDTMIFPPSLQLSFQAKTWSQYYDYTTAMFSSNTILFQHEKYLDMKMRAETGLTKELSLPPKDLIKYLKESNSSFITEPEYVKNGFTIIPFQYINSDNIEKEEKYKGYMLLNYDEEYYIYLSIEAPLKMETELNEALLDILTFTLFIRPTDIDKYYGLPYSMDKFDDLFAKKQKEAFDEFKKLYGSAKLDKTTKTELIEEVRAELLKLIKYQFTFEKYYKAESGIKLGSLSLEEWLDYELLGKQTDNLDFYETFGGNHHGESSDGNEAALDHFMKSELKTPANYETHWIWQFGDSIDANHFRYWAIITANDIEKTNETVTFICFERNEGKWTYTYSSTNESITYYFEDVRNLFSIDTVETFGGSFSDFVIINNLRTHTTYIGNKRKSGTNFIAIQNLDVNWLSYDACYTKIELDESNIFTNTPTRYNAYIENRNSIDSIVNDKALMKQVETYDDIYYSNVHEVIEENLFAAVYDILKKPIPPEKRIYKTALVVGDINKNGKQDAYTFSISNGKIVDYHLIELNESGVIELKDNEKFIPVFMTTPMFKILQQLSLKEINDEREFARF
jgi:hypothetical protein